MSSEWPNVESHSVSLPTMVSSTDLFDGELFGDELLDIYNSSVSDEHGVDANDIPNLLVPSDDGDMHHHHDNGDDNHPGMQVAHTAAAIDDGLGAFRPSTSFNDLTALLHPNGEIVQQNAPAQNSSAPVAEVAVAPSSATTGDSNKTSAAKKRKSTGSDNKSPAKKRPAAPKGGRRTSISKKPAPLLPNTAAGSSATTISGTVQPSVAIKQEHIPIAAAPPAPRVHQVPQQAKAAEDDTPNPLDIENPPTSPAIAAAPAPLAVAPAAAAPVPPRPQQQPQQKIAAQPASQPQHVQSAPVKLAPIARTVSTAAAESLVAPVTPTSARSSNDSTSGNSEADFKELAQTAVSNLIMNANSAKEGADGDDKVDTSTAHIKALTGNNWVAACTGATVGVAASVSSNNSVGGDDSKANRARRQNLTPDERARQNRDRNREHARNTRLRKKAYVEELKRTLTELVAQRDAAEFEKRQSAQRELEQREVRFRVIEEFLRIRGRNEPNCARWAAILEDGFTFTLPVASFCKSIDANVRGSEQVLASVNDVMADSCNFSDFLQTLGWGGTGDVPISFHYHCDRKNFFMDGCCAVLDWEATSVGATRKGALGELSLKGLLRCKFSPASNKLVSAVMSFDTGSVLSQLQTLKGSAGGEEAAQAAANQADAIIDSLQMPRFSAAVPSAVTVPASSGSESGSMDNKGDIVSGDEDSYSDSHEKDAVLAPSVSA